MDLVNNCLKAVSFSGQSPLLLKQLFFPESALMPQVTKKLSSFSQSHEPDAFAFFKEKFNHVFSLGRELKGPFTLFFQNKLKQEFISNIVKQVKNRMVCGYMKGFMLTVVLQIYCRNKFSLNHYYVYLYCNIVRIKELLRFFSKVSF